MVEDNDSHLYVSTFRDGVFKSVSPISELEEDDNGLHNIALYNNYPNPFNPRTSLQYAIGSRQFVTLKIYDMLGKEVATLVNEEKPAGSYEVEFNASHLSSGIYFYQLSAGLYTNVKKMIVIK